MHRYRDMNEPMRRQFLTRTVVATCLLVFRSHCSLQKASLYQAFRRPSPQWNPRSWPSRQEVPLVHLGWFQQLLRSGHSSWDFVCVFGACAGFLRFHYVLLVPAQISSHSTLFCLGRLPDCFGSLEEDLMTSLLG